MEYTINYNDRMLNYYPEVVKAIREFQLLIKTQSLEVEEMHEELTKILGNAYILTADEATISKWEQFLNITPLPQGEDTFDNWLEDRKETLLARLFQTEKMNSASIADIVKIFTGGTSVCYFKDGVVHVLINPPKDAKSYKFENVEQELKKKFPAHLEVQVERNYYRWSQTKNNHPTWGDVNNNNANWEAVLYSVS